MSDRTVATIGDLVRNYIADRKAHVLDPDGMAAHSKDLQDYFGPTSLTEVLRGPTLREMCHQYAAARPSHKSGTIRKRLSILQSAFTHAWKRQEIDTKPLMWMPPVTPPKQRDLSPEVRAAILKAADEYPTEHHVRTFVYMSVFTGLARRTILDMRWAQVNLREGNIHYQNRKRQREKVEIHPRLRPVLEQAESVKTCDFVIEWRGERVSSVYAGIKAFLRRAGLTELSPDDLRFSARAVEEPTLDDDGYVFISYCRRDGSKHAETLRTQLERLGQKCWIDQAGMKAGSFGGQLTRAVKGARAVALILTPGANDSPDVLSEVARACTAKIPVLPIVIDNTSLGEDLEHFLHTAHRMNWGATPTKTAEVALEKLGLKKL